jgi:uridylate kinase
MHYKRILVKISGQILGGKNSPLDPATLFQITQQLAAISNTGVEVAVVVGAGNLFRGETLANQGVGRLVSDQIGMLSTNINALFIQESLESQGQLCEVMSAMAVNQVLPPIDIRLAKQYLSEKKIVVFAGGTGNPFVTTDSAASLRAVEVEADVMLKGTRVDGVYTADPEQDAQAKRYEQISYHEAISSSLAIMDAEAYRICQEFAMPVYVFDIMKADSIQSIIEGKQVGTLIRGD